MKRVMLTVAYDGTNYHGWQLQTNGISIEEVLNRCLTELLKEPVQVIGASRTDSCLLYTSTEEALYTFTKNLSCVVEYAEKMGVVVAIEPVCRHIVYDARRARQVLRSIQSPNLQIILDPVNLLDDCDAGRYKDVVKEAIELLGEDVAVIHVKDFSVSDGKIVSMAAGTGIMDYSDLIRFMKMDKPYIHATLEDTVPENAVQAREFMERLWNEA